MDDFLYNLRKETDKRNRRQGNQQQYRGPDRRAGKDQRRNFQRRSDAGEQLGEALNNFLPEIKTLLETVVDRQQQLANNEDRKVRALEDIAESLRTMRETTVLPAGAPVQEVVEAVAFSNGEVDDAEAEDGNGSDPASLPRSDRAEIRALALAMRAEGKTYKQIVEHLEANQIPTFSGKGGWYPQTISKLCK